MEISCSNAPLPKKPDPNADPVATSLAKPDAFAKPAAFHNQKQTRIRTMKFKPTKGRKRKPDPRKVHFF